MTNSLLLRYKFSKKRKQVYGSYANSKIHSDSDLLADQKEKK